MHVPNDGSNPISDTDKCFHRDVHGTDRGGAISEVVTLHLAQAIHFADLVGEILCLILFEPIDTRKYTADLSEPHLYMI